ncbi:MAG: metallophosphoesterase family protein [Rhizobiaceae bacterium]|nr:metallophosphoesterase family protein [Rhizobiaceae bacterium]
MLIGILSDIHSNREAFDAALEAMQSAGAQRIVLLGDLVGYGPDPAYIVDRARALCEAGAASLLGNHDEAAATGNTSGMSENARDAIRWTIKQLSSDQLEFLATQPLSLREGDVLYTHAGAWKPQGWPYVKEAADAQRVFETQDAKISVCGHTHVPAIFYCARKGAVTSFTPLPNKPAPLFSSCRSVIVAGAVGQPRDGNPAACACLLDTDAMTATMLRVAYDWDKTAEKISAAGLPAWLGMRLKIGR